MSLTADRAGADTVHIPAFRAHCFFRFGARRAGDYNSYCSFLRIMLIIANPHPYVTTVTNVMRSTVLVQIQCLWLLLLFNIEQMFTVLLFLL